MIMRVLAAALMAGIIGGFVVAALQHLTTTPLIIAAEAYETPGGHDHGAAVATATGTAATAAPNTTQAHDHPAASAGTALSRTAATFTATVGLSVGFALLLLAGMLATDGVVTLPRALTWGMGGFLATGLAPAIGIPPELPGMTGPALGARQTWWIMTAAATAGGLYLLLRGAAREFSAIPLWQPLLGLALLAAPHIWGAPGAPEHTSAVPAGLAAQFAARALAMQAVSWLVVAAAVGLLWPVLMRAIPSPSAPGEAAHGR